MCHLISTKVVNVLLMAQYEEFHFMMNDGARVDLAQLRVIWQVMPYLAYKKYVIRDSGPPPLIQII